MRWDIDVEIPRRGEDAVICEGCWTDGHNQRYLDAKKSGRGEDAAPREHRGQIHGAVTNQLVPKQTAQRMSREA